MIFIIEGDHVKDPTEAHCMIQEVIKREEEKSYPLDSDFIFKKLYECHTKEMDSMPDILLSGIDEMDNEMLRRIPKAELEEFLAIEVDYEDLCKPMNELDIDDKFERMATEPKFTFIQNCRSPEVLLGPAT